MALADGNQNEHERELSMRFAMDLLAKLLDELRRLHDRSGPAIQYSDGYAVYAWHGVIVDWQNANVIDSPETITVSQIEKVRNVEIRRIMVERFGTSRYMNESRAQVVDQDTDPQNGHERILYRRELPNDEPLVMVKVKKFNTRARRLL